MEWYIVREIRTGTESRQLESRKETKGFGRDGEDEGVVADYLLVPLGVLATMVINQTSRVDTFMVGSFV